MRLKGVKTMDRYCDECGAYLIHRTGKGSWECSNPKCPVFDVRLKKLKGVGKGNRWRIVRKTYAAVL